MKSGRRGLYEIIGHVNDPGTDILSVVKGCRNPSGRISGEGAESGSTCSQSRSAGQTAQGRKDICETG